MIQNKNSKNVFSKGNQPRNNNVLFKKYFYYNGFTLTAFIVLFFATSFGLPEHLHAQDSVSTEAQEKATEAEAKSEQATAEAEKAEDKADQAQVEAEDAQSDAEEAQAEESEESSAPAYTGPRDEDATVTVTDVVSTRLKKMDLAGPAPELRFSAEDIFKSGRTSLADFLRDNPVTSLGSDSETAGLSAGAGAAYINLRGLGDSNTLVLINGVRFPPMSGSDSVDTNRIPMAMVKDIQIIKDDLSSIYGSDAIGGVVNIITHQGYDGFQINVGQTGTTLGGGEIFDLNFLAGSSSARSNVTFSLGYSRKEGINARDRKWSNNQISTIGNPGSYKESSATAWTPMPGCDPSMVLNMGPGGDVCSYNAADIATIFPSTDLLSMATHIDHKISDFTKVYSEFFYTRSRTEYTYAPAPGIFTIPGDVANTLSIPGHTPDSDVDVMYRATPLGNRDTLQETNFFGVTGGITHDFFDTWSVTLAGSYGLDRGDSTNFGNAITSTMQASLGPDVANGQLNPFAPVGAQGNLDGSAYTTTSTQVANFYTADLKLSGELGELFGAPYMLDMGYNYIKRDYNNRVDEMSIRNEILTGAGSNGAAERDIHALYAQLNGRLSQSLDVYLSGRYDKFSDFGDVFNPKIGLKYRPTSSLMFRSTVGTGYKAPALSLLYGDRSDGYLRFIDNVACDRDGPGSQSCTPVQYRVQSGGNPDLDAIESFSYSAGFVFEPSNLLDISVDFWAVEQKGMIIGGSEGTLYEATRAELAGINPADYGFVMNRDGAGNLDPTNPIVAPLMNLLDQKTAGLDVGFNYKLGLPVGQLVFSDATSIRLWQKSNPFPGMPFRDDVKEGLVPGWRNQLSVGYKLLSNDFRFTVVSTDKYKNAARTGYVDSNHRLDFSYNYSGIADTTLTLGMINLLQTDPPLDSTNPSSPLDATLYSQRGPEYYLRLTKTF